MLILGHVGIASAAVRMAETALKTSTRQRTDRPTSSIDYRLLALGALLPDLIDKPLAFWISPEAIGTTRSVGHTLSLSFALLILGYLSYWRGKKLAVLSLALGCLSHLILDGMWAAQQTLLWPALGFGFPEGGHQEPLGFLWRLWHRPWEPPWLGPSEVVGGLMIGSFFFRLWRERLFRYFFQTGRFRQ